jgi:phage virion morphogenesis protein
MDLSPLDAELAGLAARLDPGARKALAARLAKDLQAANRQRIRDNVQADGAEMVPRKRPTGKLRDKPGAVRRKAQRMFQGAAAPRYLRREASDGEARVGFVGAMARIMRVHQLGLRDTVTRDPRSPEVTYPARRVIDFSAGDRARILATVIEHVDG